MELTLLTGFDVYYAFVAGAKKLITEKKYLNDINVFPVPDGDTGTNMSYLMQTIINEAKPTEAVNETLESISNAALNGSRGNSGIIFAEFFHGLYEGLKEKATARIEDFHKAVKNAIQKAYRAMMNPVEGTILTVLRKAFDHPATSENFKLYFHQSLEQAEQALKETTEQLEILKKNHVVDAGAKGFTIFLEGINEYLKYGKEYSEIPNPIVERAEEVHEHEMVVEERYCTEAMLMDVRLSTDEWKDVLKDEGSSLIVAGRSDRVRIHIHTNRPDQFFLKIRRYGKIIEQKVDDMIRQQQAIGSNHPKIALVCDSIADIPEELLDEYQIHRIPINLLLDDVNYLDKVSITSDTFYEMMDSVQQYSSSQPDMKTVERHLEFLKDHYESILVVTVASKLSGTYQVFKKYAEENPTVRVIDSKQNSGAEGLVVYHAAKQIAEEKSIDEVVQSTEEFIKRTKIYVSVKTLKYMVRSGRLSKVTGFAAKIMNLKPVVSLSPDGEGTIASKAFSLRGNIKKIMKLLKQGPIESYAIVHALAEDRAKQLANKVQELTGQEPLYITPISPIVAMSAGIGAVAVAVTFVKEVN